MSKMSCHPNKIKQNGTICGWSALNKKFPSLCILKIRQFELTCTVNVVPFLKYSFFHTDDTFQSSWMHDGLRDATPGASSVRYETGGDALKVKDHVFLALDSIINVPELRSLSLGFTLKCVRSLRGCASMHSNGHSVPGNAFCKVRRTREREQH